MLAPWIHDWGEIVVEGEGIGDITFDKKNEAHEELETVIFNKVISLIESEHIKEKLHKTYQDVVMKRSKKIGEMFNAVERLGYLTTALKSSRGNRHGKRIKNWKGMAGNVLSNQIEKLVSYAGRYPYVNFLLNKESKNIDKIFKEIINLKIPMDNTHSPSYDSKKLKRAYSVWTNFCS